MRIHKKQMLNARLYSPSPMYNDVSFNAKPGGVSGNIVVSSSYNSANKDNVIVNRGAESFMH